MPDLPAATAPDAAALWLWPPVLLFDGRVANRSWLQETPEPVSHIAWSSWIDIHPGQAARLGIGSGDFLELRNERGALSAPARVTDEVAESTVAIALGQGHSAMGVIAAGRGANGFALFNPGLTTPFGTVRIRKLAGHKMPAFGAATKDQHHRELLQWIKLEKLRTSGPSHEEMIMPLPEGYKKQRDLYPPHDHVDHRWAMVIDLHKCIGCAACTVACFAENNLFVVGEERFRAGRHLTWLRVIPYRHPKKPMTIGWLPMLCQHCDAAPCEPVCPVFAAVHTREGLNAQIYNRCIGTRYCSNNCPYKVRRFNWLTPVWRPPLEWQLNPEVTVRTRGVMEKCTFCVQRIRRAEYAAKRERRKIRDGEIQPACVQSCPAKVFTFGDLLDEQSALSQLFRRDPRRYQLLRELNTKPAIAYLRRVEME